MLNKGAHFRMECTEKKQLIDDYLERTQAVSIEVELLLHTVEGRPGNQESASWAQIETARAHCEAAYSALLTHLKDHGCGGPASAL